LANREPPDTYPGGRVDDAAAADPAGEAFLWARQGAGDRILPGSLRILSRRQDLKESFSGENPMALFGGKKRLVDWASCAG
jgi:hypothetical protein